MQPKYEILIYWSAEDNAYLAEVPELPGCMADGASYQEALKNAELVPERKLSPARNIKEL
jgi:predicted RNase H-like HicB family nuclease